MTVNLYPPSIHEGDLSPGPMGSKIDDICNEIHDATKGWGTDEKRLLKALGKMTPEQRCKVPNRYKDLYNKDLSDVMKSECGNRDFGVALQLLAEDPVSAECEMIHRSCQGAGTNETLLYTIISGRSNAEMELLKKKYFDKFGDDLGRTLDGELGGDFEQFIINAIQASEQTYDPDYHTNDQMEEDIQKLYKLGQGKWFGTDETSLFKILFTLPPQYLKKLNMKYSEEHGVTLAKAMERELSGKVEDAVVFLVGMKVDPEETVAKLIDKACQGFGTNELLLTATLIRYQLILKGVMAAHQELYNKSLEDRIGSEIGHDFRDVLLEVIETAKHL